MADYSKLATEARRTVLGMIHKAQTSHIGSNLSVIDIATVLYENLKEGDEVVWSPSWKAATIYYFLAKTGKIPESDLDLFYKEIDGKIPYLGLAETNVPGVWVNGGSVGHGLPVAVGMALAKERAGEEGTIYCILSDGELNEGSVWEAAMLAAHHKLDNLVAIVDANGWQAMGRTEDVIDINPMRAFLGFDWWTSEINGHDYKQIYEVFSNYLPGRPHAIVARTIKGKGVSRFEDHLLYHYKNVTLEEYEEAIAELDDPLLYEKNLRKLRK